MDAQDFRSLQEAYSQVYQVDEKIMSEAKVDAGLADYQKREARYKRNNYDKPLLSYTQPPARGRKKVRGEKREDKYGVDRMGNPTGKYKKMKEQADIYDIILSHLLDEDKMSLDKERRTRIGRQIGNRIQSASIDIDASKSGFMPKGIRDKLRKSAAKKVEQTRKMMGALKSAQKNESYDIYDIILSHLLDEGYAETPEAAEAIMVNMSEEWRDNIVEADSIAAMRERAAKRRKQRYGDERFGRDDFKSNEQKKKEADARMQAYLDSKAKERG